MAQQFLHIEWSGFWDFPGGRYNSGSKAGDNVTGQFYPALIDIDKTSSVDYEIDPGKIAIPQSRDWDFTLINKVENGDTEIFPFEYFANLGRTEEYGGTFNLFGDLFVRATIPALDNKVIFKGVVDSIQYNAYHREVKVNCVSIIEVLKSIEKPFFIKHEFGSCKMNHDRNFEASSLLNDLAGNDQIIVSHDVTIGDSGFDTVVDINGDPVKMSKLRALSVEDIDEEWREETGTRLYDNGEMLYQISGGDLDDAVNSFYRSQADTLNKLWSQNPLARRFPDSIIEVDSDSQIGTEGDEWYREQKRGAWHTGFVKIGNSTILTKFRLQHTVEIRVGSVGGDNAVREFKNHLDLEVIHADNGKIVTQRGDDTIHVLERGAFFKDGNNYEESIIKNEDELDVTLIDWKNTDGSTNEEFTTSLADDTFTQFGHFGGFDLKDKNMTIIHGAVFGTSGGNSQSGIMGNTGWFNNLLSIKDIARKLIARYMTSEGDDYDFLDISELEENTNQHCFVADLVHYGFDTNISEAIVNTAQQVSAYLFNNEKGQIKYLPRSVRSGVLNNVMTNSYDLNPDDYEVTSGNDYSFGSRYWKFTYQDKVEVNNLTGEEEFDVIVNTDGEIADTQMKPEEIEVNNYRTTNLGVPAEDEVLPNNDNQRYFRYSLNNDNQSIPKEFMIPTPLEQASRTAQSKPFPSSVFSISLDMRYGDYDGLGIGSYIRERDRSSSVGYKFYMVRKISYNPSSIMRDSTSVDIELVNMGIAEGHTTEEEGRDEIVLGQTVNVEKLLPTSEEATDEIVMGMNFSISVDEAERYFETPDDEIVMGQTVNTEVDRAVYPPQNVDAVRLSYADQVNLEWEAPIGGHPDHYEIGHRRPNFASWGTRNVTPPTTSSGHLIYNTGTHQFRIRAVVNGETSEWIHRSVYISSVS